MKAPNFFIVGAPKCGTTALAAYLGQHPEIFMCTPKEPHYFAEDLPRYRYCVGMPEYLQLFAGADDRQWIRGEASVFYMYSEVAIARIFENFPNAKLVVMLRNPMELAVSMHAQALLTRDENVVNFEKAWQLCEVRRRGESLPRKCRDPKVLLYDQLPMLGHQVERLLEIFPNSQVRWYLYDSFRLDPGRIYRDVLNFLGIRDDGRSAFPVINRRRVARFQWLAELTQKTPVLLTDMALSAKRCLRIKELGLLEWIRGLNFRPAESSPLPSGLYMAIQAHFAADTRLLARITGENLDAWLAPPR